MTTSKLLVLGVLEIIALIFITRLWVKRRHRSFAARLFWSLVLLVPLLGVLFYVFLRENPDEHPYDTDTTSGAAKCVAESDGQH